MADLEQREQDEQRQQTEQSPALDSPLPGPTQTGRAVSIARLLHHECGLLLQLYKEKESFLSSYSPDGGRMVSPSPVPQEEASGEQRVEWLHAALRQCLGLLHSHLLLSTRGLLEGPDTTLEVTPEHQGTEEPDGAGGLFGLKVWTYRVLLELHHWADHAAETLHVFHTERGGAAVL
ncbi:hypothetical protein JOQ06_020795 [Pogonophryne albipinna]|uniref:Ciliary neurotrophic factor n=1 Tax=Pogonophryne albipinna TaxID=1090488 RepID=A0AAD6FX03_9TELE|nr:hypothetical protein JOQ06_020795 [Pogonophryne albipinna]